MSEPLDSKNPPPEPTWQGPIIEKTPPRPAPTEEYSWRTYNPNAKVIYIRSHEHANQVLAALHPSLDAFGFDLEWRPTYTKGRPENPVALVQIANDDDIMLFQLTAMREFPSMLAELLANPKIVKAGNGIQYDARKLFNDYHVPLHNCVDLTLLARTVDNARWAGKYNSPLGLARLIESYEYKLLPKGKVTRSNWEAKLSPPQQEYASNDAHAGYILYRRLQSMMPLMESKPQSMWYSFNSYSGFLYDERGQAWQPVNPNYDPGPLPPPKEPKPLTEAQIERQERRKQNRKDHLPEQTSAASASSGVVELNLVPSTSIPAARPSAVDQVTPSVAPSTLTVEPAPPIAQHRNVASAPGNRGQPRNRSSNHRSGHGHFQNGRYRNNYKDPNNGTSNNVSFGAPSFPERAHAATSSSLSSNQQRSSGKTNPRGPGHRRNNPVRATASPSGPYNKANDRIHLLDRLRDRQSPTTTEGHSSSQTVSGSTRTPVTGSTDSHQLMKTVL